MESGSEEDGSEAGSDVIKTTEKPVGCSGLGVGLKDD